MAIDKFTVPLTNNPTPTPAKDPVRHPWPQFNAFRPYVTSELVRRKTSYPAPISTPFVRLTSCKQDPVRKYSYFTLGLHGFNTADINIFDEAYSNKRDIVGYAYDMTAGNGPRPKRLVSSDELTQGAIPQSVKDYFQGNADLFAGIDQVQSQIMDQQKTVYALGTHPIPGVTNVQIQRRGIGSPLIAKIKYVCFNRAQLEFLRNHFMVVGGYVVLEWGQNFPDKQVTKMLDFSTGAITKELVTIVTEGRGYVSKMWVEPNDGNYDVLVGYVGNFQVEMEPRTNTYTVNLTVYTAGEHLFGINSYLTYVNKNDPVGSAYAHEPTTIHGFFGKDSTFLSMVEEASHVTATGKKYVADFHIDWADPKKNNYVVKEEWAQYSNNPDDHRFVSWEFFMTKVIPAVFGLLKDGATQKELMRMIQLDEITDPNNPYSDDWVGDHPYLRSVDPDTMILVKKDMRGDSSFSGIGFFGEEQNANGYRGKLYRGVWLNVAMIRQAFLSTNSFLEGLNYLLNKMNNATMNYWGLRLFFDEEIAKYRISDAQHINHNYLTAFYRFNSKTQGEALNINFDSAFPPELVTQMALYSYYKSVSYSDQQQLLKDFPSIGTTSTFMFALNWTNLEDLVEKELASLRTDPPAPAVMGPVVVNADQATPERMIARMAGEPLNYGANQVSSTHTQGVAQPIGAISVVDPNQSLENLVTTARKTAAAKELPEFSAIYPRSLKYKTLIDKIAADTGVDGDLIRGVIAHESGFISNQLGDGRATGGRGLMQIVYSTAVAAGFTGTKADLLNDQPSVYYGTLHLRDYVRQFPGDVEAAVSMYNGELNPTTGVPRGKRFPPPNGRFDNQNYVDRVIGFYNMFRLQAGKEPVKTGANDDREIRYPPSAPTDNNLEQLTPGVTTSPYDFNVVSQDDSLARWFGGSSIANFIEMSPSYMIARITKQGPDDYDGNKPNSYFAPYPTTSNISVEILGISGLSVTDGFLVDKLPFIFEKYGCFQITEINDSLTTAGWTTKISGYFKLLWMNGDGPKPPAIGDR